MKVRKDKVKTIPVYVRLEEEVLKRIDGLGFARRTHFIRFAIKRTLKELERIENQPK